jgi:FAD-linked sulfhydryl oxidase
MAILDEDCERPACDDIKMNLPSSMEELHSMAKKQAAKKKVECPPRSAELGRSSWKLLHSMAAWYPDQPKPEQREKMTQFMTSLAEFYPCTWCASDFQENVKKTPVA